MVSAVRGRAGRVGKLAQVGVLVLLLGAGAYIGLDASGHVNGVFFDDASPRPSASPSASPSPSPAGPVLAPATSATVAAAGLVLDQRLLADPDFGGDLGAYVVDVVTGEVLLDRDSGGPRTPASVAKLATAAGALVVLGPQTRLQTRTVTGARPGDVVLVGGGDTTLTVRAPGEGVYPRPASLAELADATVAAMRAEGVGAVTVSVDDSLFDGPAVSPDWEPSYLPAGVVSPVSALTVNGGRVRSGFSRRVADPAVHAGQRLARLLADRGLTVTGEVTRTTAAPGAEQLASVSSPEVATLVESMLATSDNDLAESLLRLAAAGRDQPATFTTGTDVVTDVLAELGVTTDGLLLLDGSGLARGSRMAPETLGELLALAATDSDPRLRSLVTGLPVAGFSGTLADRFGPGGAPAGAGFVRAKTGTLTGVASLAGLAASGDDAAPRLLAFAVLTDDVAASDTLAARDAMDRVAAGLAGPDR